MTAALDPRAAAAPPQAAEPRPIELRPIHTRGELAHEDWWAVASPAPRPFLRRNAQFMALVAAPTLAAATYFGLVAAPIYESEAQFLVRTSSRSDAANFASLLQNQKISRATDETYAVAHFVSSRDAVRALVDRDGLKDAMSRPAADFIARFPNFYSRNDFEALYRHFLRFVDVRVDSESGIATLRVRAFAPDDAQALNSALVRDAETLVNRLNERLYADALKSADAYLEEERSKLADVQRRLTAYRNAEGVVDPAKESAVALNDLGKLTSALLQAESALTQETAEAPESPHVASLQENVAALRSQVEAERRRISGDRTSLASKLGEYDELMLDRELAARGIAAAQAHQVAARQDAEQQQFYLQTVVEPNRPDQAAYPRRVLSILLVAAVAFSVHLIVRTAIRNVREHAP